MLAVGKVLLDENSSEGVGGMEIVILLPPSTNFACSCGMQIIVQIYFLLIQHGRPDADVYRRSSSTTKIRQLNIFSLCNNIIVNVGYDPIAK